MTEAKPKKKPAKKAEPKTEPKAAPPAPKPVKISATRLKAVAEKTAIMARHGKDAVAQLEAMTVGKDPERSPIIAKVAALATALDLVVKSLETVPETTADVMREVEALL